jgi:hypothetical protein
MFSFLVSLHQECLCIAIHLVSKSNPERL